MSSWQIMLTEYAWIALWWIFCLWTGSASLTLIGLRLGPQTLRAPNRELALFFCMSAGVSLQIVVLILLAVAGLLNPTIILIVFAAIAVASRKVHTRFRSHSWANQIFSPCSKTQLLSALPLLMLLAAWMIRPLGPAMDHDEVSYHLPYARFYIQNAGLAVNELLRFPLHTHNFNMLYVLALLRDSVPMAHLMHASAGFLVMLGVHGFARVWFGLAGAIVSVVLLLTMGVMQQAFGNAFVDLGLMLFVASAMFALVMWQQSRKTAWLVIAAVFLGMAMGTKYMGLLFTVPLGLWVLWVERKPSTLLRFTLLTSLFGLFWYLRSALISGNPVHPFLSEVFGYYIWTRNDLLGTWADLTNNGVSHTLTNFFMLPVLLFSEAPVFSGKAGFMGILIGGFYVGLLFWRRMPQALRPMAIIALIYLVFWFNSSQVLRYLLPVAPVMALVGGLALVETGKHLRRWFRRWKIPAPSLADDRSATLLLVVAAVYLGYHFGQELEAVPITAEEQKPYLTRNVAGYELFKAAAADSRIGGGPLMQFHFEGSIFHFPGLVVGDWVGPFAYTSFMELNAEGSWQLLPAEQLAEKLSQNNIRGVVFQNDSEGMFYPPDLGAYDRVFEFVFKNNYGMVMVPRKLALEKEKLAEGS